MQDLLLAMRRRSRVALPTAVGLALTLGACQDVAAPTSSSLRAPSASTHDSYSKGRSIDNEYIVVFNDDVDDVSGRANALLKAHGGELHTSYESALRGFSAHLSAQQLEARRNDPSVSYVESDQVVEAAGVQSPVGWWLDRIDQRSSVLDLSYSWTASGVGVTVYILDSGIRITHQDFGGRASYGYDFVGNSATASDCNGHGTYVAGLVGGTQYGAAKGASLSAVRVLDCNGVGSTSTIIAGLDWVAKNHSSRAVAALAFSTSASPSLNQAVASVVASGVAVVAAAGNDGLDACGYSPGSEPSAITVGATLNQYSSDNQLSSSNYGTCVDLFAPGYQIGSDWYTSDTQWQTMTGTSPAAALAAGAAAVYLEANPSATSSQVSAAIVGNATTGVIAGLGAGSPNRLLYVGGSSPLPPPSDTGQTSSNLPPTAKFTASCSKANCTFNASGSTDDHGIVRYDWAFGDGGTGTGTAPTASHTYTAKGTYSMKVTLTVTDAGGLKSSVTNTLTIKNSGK